MKTFWEIGYVAFVVALVATAFFGVQALMEMKPAIAETKPIIPARSAKVAVTEEPVKKELSPLYPVNPNKELLNTPQKTVEMKPAKPRVVAAANRVKPSSRARKSTTQIAALPKPTVSNSYAQEAAPRQDDIFGSLFAKR